MKKSLVILAALAVMSSASFAAGLSVGVEQENLSVKNGSTINATTLTSKYQLVPSLAIDGRLTAGRVAGGQDVGGVEVGASTSVALTKDLSLGLRGAVGRFAPQGGDSVNYRLVDATGTYAVTPRLGITVGERFVNRIGGGSAHAPLAAVNYSLTSKDIVSVGYKRYEGGLDAKSISASYTRLF